MNKEMDDIIKEIQGSMQESYHGKPEEEKPDETVDTDTETDLEDEAEDENVEETDTSNDTDGDAETDTDDSDTDTDDDNSDNDGTDNADYLVEVQGRKYTEQELLDLHSNGLRQADYSKKTAELAEQRKAFEAEKQEAMAKLEAEYEEKLKAVTQYLPDVTQYTPEKLVLLAEENPHKYREVKAQLDAWENLTQNQQKLEQERFNRKADEETAKLMKMEPAFANDFDNAYKQTLEYMVEHRGYTQEEALKEIDARTIKSHYDSMMYSKGAKVAKKKVKILGKSSGNQAKEKPPTAAKTRAKQVSGVSTREDLAALIEQDYAG